MTVQETSPSLQAVCLVNGSDIENEESSTASTTIHLAVHPDPVSGKDIILWDDIKATFPDVIHVRSGTIVQSFLKGSDFETLRPLRIAAVPGVTLEIVFRDKTVLSVESLREALPAGVDENTRPNSDTTVATSGRSPAYGLENIAMEASMNNENTDAKPSSRGPQTLPDDKSPPFSSATHPTPQNEEPITEPPRAPQETAADAAKNVARTMMNARLGDNKSLVALGDMYRDGQGVRQDYKAAMDRYTKAATLGNADAKCNIGLLYYNGQGVSCDYREACVWYSRAADQGNARARYLLGRLHAWGRGVSYQDYREAAEYYLEAANQGYAPAQCAIGDLHQRGFGVDQNYSVAMEWYLKASDQGYADGFYSIGYLHHQGFGVAQDDSQAMEWYLKAAELGHETAQANAGVMYQHGQGVPQNDALALDWYRKAAAQGNANAQFNLGLTYEYGMGVLLNREKAVEWYKKAAHGGDDDAKEKLKELEQHHESA